MSLLEYIIVLLGMHRSDGIFCKITHWLWLTLNNYGIVALVVIESLAQILIVIYIDAYALSDSPRLDVRRLGNRLIGDFFCTLSRIKLWVLAEASVHPWSLSWNRGKLELYRYIFPFKIERWHFIKVNTQVLSSNFTLLIPAVFQSVVELIGLRFYHLYWIRCCHVWKNTQVIESSLSSIYRSISRWDD